MPDSMFLVFVATVLAGSLGAIHYTIVHIIMRRPFDDRPTPGKAPPRKPPAGPGGGAGGSASDG